MTATLPQPGPPFAGGPGRVPVDARPGAVYCYDVLDAVTRQIVPADYVGQSRNPVRRDKEHRGQLPQRDGTVREQPWADLIVGGQRILEHGVWTDTELDARELAWMAHLQPRLNCKDSTTPDRIPIWLQRQQRDQRDIAAGLTPRDWTRPAATSRPVTSPTATYPNARSQFAGRVTRWAGRQVRTAARIVLPWAAVWLALAVALIVWADMPPGQDSAGIALAGTGAVYAGWRKLTRPKKRSRRRTR